ncbi:MAG: hypothetical protein WCA13_11240 [Terriglobales bacterium]
MPLYPVTIRRCQHIKINGTQCASPALRDEKHCYYHKEWRRKSSAVNLNVKAKQSGTITLPSLEDANSIQVTLAELLRLLATNQIDCRRAALMLYALQTASANVKHTSFEPEPTRVVIDRECVGQRPIGTTAWSALEGCEYDDLTADGLAPDPRIQQQEKESRERFERWQAIIDKVPANERQLPNESQRDRDIRVQKQRAQAAEAAKLKPDSESRI